MTIFRWVMGVLALGFGGGALASFLLFVALDVDAWLQRARALRRGFYVVALLWFNLEVWGRVVWTLWTWNR